MQSFLTATIFAILVVPALCGAGKLNSPQLTVLTIVNPPYVSQVHDKLSGFVIDLLGQIAKIAGFTYKISIQPDGFYGAKKANGNWNGIVGSLVNKQADIAAVDLTITAERENVIDFTRPYLASQVRVLTNVKTGTNNVKYLVLKDSSYASYLKMSADPKAHSIWASIQANKGFVSTVQQGVDKVLSGGFAFVSDVNTLNPFLQANPGKLQLSPDVIQTQFLAFAVQKGSPLEDQISLAISQLDEGGQLQTLINKYQLG